MYSIAAPVIGAFITIMNGINSRFSALVGALPAALTIHLVGFFLISGILIVKRLGA
ncbi:MAG: DMT family transporter, partial [Spirochaetales bacterium]|nr:DMT family transporter [Spirochaetales bacterium]